jgi:hypothetical protein
MQPCSSLEKTVHAFVWNVVIALGIYYLIFSIINPFLHHWATGYENNLYQKALPHVTQNFIPPNLLSPLKSTDILWLVNVLVIQVIILDCMLFFKRYAVIKTILLIIFIVLVYNGILTKLNDFLLLPDGWKSLEQNLYKITNEGYEEYLEIESADWLKLWVQNSLIPVWALLWVVLYFLIKEQEA